VASVFDAELAYLTERLLDDESFGEESLEAWDVARLGGDATCGIDVT
jgi:hypothetical protein